MAAQYRLTASAKADINALLDESTHRHGQDARNRYAALLLAALRRIAQNPEGGATAARPELHPDMRSFHIRHRKQHYPGRQSGACDLLPHHRTRQGRHHPRPA